MAHMFADETTADYEHIFKRISKSIIYGITSKEILYDVIYASAVGVFFGLFFWCCDLEMSKDAWFYVFSALSQTLAAFIAFGAMFLVYRLNTEREKEKRIKLIAKVNTPYSLMITSVAFSIILLTFGQINIHPNWVTNDWLKLFKYSISFFTIALGIFGMVRAGDLMWWSRIVNEPVENAEICNPDD